MVATGHTYDRICIERWLAQVRCLLSRFLLVAWEKPRCAWEHADWQSRPVQGNRTCPVTGMRLRHLELTPNFALRNAIQVPQRPPMHMCFSPCSWGSCCLVLGGGVSHGAATSCCRSGLPRIRSWSRTRRAGSTRLSFTRGATRTRPPTYCRCKRGLLGSVVGPVVCPRSLGETHMAGVGCRVMMRLCGRWRSTGSGCSRPPRTRPFASGTLRPGAVSR